MRCSTSILTLPSSGQQGIDQSNLGLPQLCLPWEFPDNPLLQQCMRTEEHKARNWVLRSVGGSQAVLCFRFSGASVCTAGVQCYHENSLLMQQEADEPRPIDLNPQIQCHSWCEWILQHLHSCASQLSQHSSITLAKGIFYLYVGHFWSCRNDWRQFRIQPLCNSWTQESGELFNFEQLVKFQI